MASIQALLHAAPSEVTFQRVQAVVQQTGPESIMIEYKETLKNAKEGTVARAVAALANTYGGLVLIGVTDDRKIKGVPGKLIDAVAEHCHGKIEPPWVPEIIPVALEHESDSFVLVLRVPPDHPNRPFLVDGTAYMRHHSTTHPADWQRLRDLFAQSAASVSQTVWTIQRPDLPRDERGLDDGRLDFVIRSGLDLPISVDAKWRPLSDSAVDRFISALNNSALDAALAVAADDPAGVDQHDFHRAGLNRSRTVSLEAWKSPANWPREAGAPITAKARLDVPGAYGDTAQNLHVEIDIVARFSPRSDEARWKEVQNRTGQPPWARIDAPTLRTLIDAILETLTSAAVVEPLAALAGIDMLAVPQPRVMHLATLRSVSEVLEITGLQQIPGAGESRGAHLLADPGRDLADSADRASQVVDWLIQIALDAGFRGMEQMLSTLP